MADKLSVGTKAFGLITCAFTANLAAVKMFEYPLVYCLGDSFLKPMFGPLLVFLNLSAILVFIWKLASRDYVGAFFVGIATMLIFGIPDFIDILFRLGSSCG